jgi:hypothetical protein
MDRAGKDTQREGVGQLFQAQRHDDPPPPHLTQAPLNSCIPLLLLDVCT